MKQKSQVPMLWLPVALAASGLYCLTARGASAAPTIQPKVLHAYPHDPQAFAQGLELFSGKFYESTGLRGRSSIRRVDPSTGTVEQQVALPANEFGEGLTIVGQQLIQLTWREQVAHVYDLADLHEIRSFSYTGEGWGICFDGQRLVMSDGSSSLTLRDPNDFSVIGKLAVTNDGVAVTNLNELECVGSDVYANIWQSNSIARIDGQTGAVLTLVNAAGLLNADEKVGADVLNGIAFDPASKHFFLTGKLWPKVFEVELPGLPTSGASSPPAVTERPKTSQSSQAPQRTAVGLGGRGCACALTGAPPRSLGSGFALVVAASLGLLLLARRRAEPSGYRKRRGSAIPAAP